MNLQGKKFFQYIDELHHDKLEPKEQYQLPVSKDEALSKIIDIVGRMYQGLDISVRDICFAFDFEYDPKYQKLFYNLYGPKNQGHGGSRKGKSKSRKFNKNETTN